MQKILLIISREFSTRVRKKSFILLTLLMPLVMVALVFVPLWLSSIKDSDERLVYVVDPTGKYAPLFENTGSYRFETVQKDDAAFYAAEGDNLPEAVVIISGDLADSLAHATASIHSRKTVSSELLTLTQTCLSEQVRRERLEATGVPEIERIIETAAERVDVQTVQRDAEGSAKQSSTHIAMAVGLVFCFLIYMFVMAYGAMVMSSVTEEKTGRIFEIIVGSVKPFQLMMGKIIGVALVGLLQLLIWGVLLGIILGAVALTFGADAAAGASAATMPAAGMSPADVATAMPQAGENAVVEALLGVPFVEIGVLFVVYFVFGYLLYAALFAAVGASINSPEDASQFTMPMVIIMIFALYAGMYSVENTDGPLAFWASMVPFTSPIAMMVRVPFGVPLWQEALSLVLLVGTSLLLTWIAGRIYRIGILMYGKKPTWKELWRWARME